jgi:hypothetical protein
VISSVNGVREAQPSVPSGLVGDPEDVSSVEDSPVSCAVDRSVRDFQQARTRNDHNEKILPGDAGLLSSFLE